MNGYDLNVDATGKRYARKQSPRVDCFGAGDGKKLKVRKGNFPSGSRLHQIQDKLNAQHGKFKLGIREQKPK